MGSAEALCRSFEPLFLFFLRGESTLARQTRWFKHSSLVLTLARSVIPVQSVSMKLIRRTKAMAKPYQSRTKAMAKPYQSRTKAVEAVRSHWKPLSSTTELR